MTNHDHEVDRALRRVTGNPTPSEADLRLGRAKLEQALAADARKLRSWRPRRLVLTTLFGLVGLVALIFAAVETLNPAPIRAALEEIAEVAADVDPLTIPPQRYAYFSSETTALAVIPNEGIEDIEFTGDFLAYLLPTIREIWIGGDGTVQIRTTNQTPRFFNEADEIVYYQAGLDELDAIGTTETLTTSGEPTETQWPEDLKELDAAIRDLTSPTTEVPETVQYLDTAAGILRESSASPALRSATLRLIGRLPGPQLVSTGDDGAVTISIEYVDQGINTRKTYVISRDGALLMEEIRILEPDVMFRIPPETAIFTATYEPPIFVDSLNGP